LQNGTGALTSMQNCKRQEGLVFRAQLHGGSLWRVYRNEHLYRWYRKVHKKMRKKK
jgi:hypothetical protein